MNKTQKTYLITGAAVIVSALAGFLIVKKIKNRKKGQNNLVAPLAPSTSPPINNSMVHDYSQQTGSKSGYFNAKSIAGKLFNAMKGVGTDEAVIKSALQGLKRGQLQQVIDAFGTPLYNKTSGVATSKSLFGKKRGLQEWLKNELSSSELEPIKEIFIQHGIVL